METRQEEIVLENTVYDEEGCDMHLSDMQYFNQSTDPSVCVGQEYIRNIH